MSNVYFLLFLFTTFVVFLGLYVLKFPINQRAETVYIKLQTDKSTYKLGEKIQIIIFLVNDKSDKISLPSLNYALEIFGSQGIVLTMVESRGGTGPVNVEALSQLLIETYTWNQEDMNKNQVSKGIYTLRVNLLDAFSSYGFDWSDVKNFIHEDILYYQIGYNLNGINPLPG
jgi:hypothetical protein